MVTTDLWGSGGCNDGPNGDVNYSSHFAGTSAAAPQVAGAAALLIALNPGLTEAQVRARLKATADPWWDCNAYLCGSGKLNIGRAASLYYPPPTTVQISGPASVRKNVQCTWTASASGGSGSYSYSWVIGADTVGMGETLNYQNAGTSFSLTVYADDGTQAPGVQTIGVTADNQAPECLIQ